MKTKTKTTNKLNVNRFVIRKSLLGTNTVLLFTNKTTGEKWEYDHDEVYSVHQERFASMPCFQLRKVYTQTHSVPKFCRDLAIQVK